MTTLKWKQPKARELLGGDLAAQSLAQLGVNVAFGLHGGHLDAFLVGCDLAGIKLIDTRHETVAVQAAEGYSKLSGKVGIAFVTANSGFCNSLPGIATAFADRSPVFVLTSSPPLRDAETNALQGFHDQVVLSKPMTKFAHRVTNVEEIPRIVSFAFRTAQSGTPGPVVIDFPIDVLFSPPRMSAISYGAVMMGPASPPAPDLSALARLAELWSRAKRPVLITGTGASRTTTPGSDKSPLLSLAEATSTPIFYSSKFAPAIPFSSPLRGGPAGRLAVLPHLQADRPDLVILLGARTGFLLGGRNHAIIPPDATIVQIDIDGAEIGRSLPVSLGIVSDASFFIDTYLALLKSSSSSSEGAAVAPQDRTGWLSTISKLTSLQSPHASEPTTIYQDHNLLHPYHALKALFTSLPPDSIILIDGGEAGVWALDLLEEAKPSHALVSTGYLGFLGNGYGYTLGAALAYPEKLIVNLHGDGSAGFHIAELDTYARHGLKVLTVVVNNYFWGMSIAGQDLLYATSEPNVRPVSTLSPSCRFDIVAQGFGCNGEIITKFDDIAPTTKKLIAGVLGHGGADAQNGTTQRGGASGGVTPGLVNLIVSRQPVTATTKSMVGKTDEEGMIVVPYYDNVPRAYYKENGV